MPMLNQQLNDENKTRCGDAVKRPLAELGKLFVQPSLYAFDLCLLD